MKIEIKFRQYNGHYGKGSVFSRNGIFELDQDVARISSNVEFCLIDDNIENKIAKINVSIPVILSDEENNSLTNIVNDITNNQDYKYNDKHYSKTIFDPKRLQYVDIIIDGTEYETDNKDLVNNILDITKIVKLNDAIKVSYDKLLES